MTDAANGIVIVPTRDAATVRILGTKAGLEDTGRCDERVAAAWLACDDAGRAVGAVALERSAGMDVVNWLSVDEAYRGRGIGTRLLSTLEAHARALNMARLWATARAPGLFLANGYREVADGREARILLGDCVTCRQYRRGCEPRAVAKDLV